MNGTQLDSSKTKLRVVVNFLNNAAKYADENSVTDVTISVDGQEVRVDVADKSPTSKYPS